MFPVQNFWDSKMHRTLLKTTQKTSNSPHCGSDNPFSASTQKPVHQESIRSSSRKQYQRIIPEILRRGSSFIPSCTVLYRVWRHRNSPIRREILCRFCVWTVSLFGVDGRKKSIFWTRRLWKKVWFIELSAWEKIWTTKLSKYLRRFRLMRHRLADATEGNVWVP